MRTIFTGPEVYIMSIYLLGLFQIMATTLLSILISFSQFIISNLNIVNEFSRMVFPHKFIWWIFDFIRFLDYLEFLEFERSFGILSHHMSSRFNRSIFKIV